MPVKRSAVRIQKGCFSVDAALGRLLSGKVGGIVLFVGSVRGSSPGGKVPHLDFQAYRPMAKKKLEEIRARAIKRFGAEDVHIIHRTGRIASGERIVLVAASAAHRDAAFKACRFVLEALKREAPIWKKERGFWTGPKNDRGGRK
jgi:molybdopterin synthase catalytic subunit